MNRMQDAAQLIARAKRPMVFTGAGISAESGIPTFRDALSGLWEKYDPQLLATAEGFSADPQLVWDWYRSRRNAAAAALPNAAHMALAGFQQRTNAALITQNVDGLHTRAGAAHVVELHGNILRASCFAQCGWVGDAAVLEAADAAHPPHCPQCGALARPDVVWFGEMLPASAWTEAENAAADCDVCIVIGTSAMVYPAAGLPLSARRHGAALIVINPEPTDLDALADVVIHATAGAAVPRLILL